VDAVNRGLLDTSVVIALGDETGLESALPSEVAISAATLAELHFGVLLAKDDFTRQARLRRLGMVEATMQSLAMSLVIAREDGRLKRGRGTPMPPWVFIAGRIGNSVVLSLLMFAIVVALGRVLYGVAIPWSHLPQLLVILAIGAASFCCLGIALTAAIPTQDAAAPIVNALLLPLYFLSGVFIPDGELPNGVIDFANNFPVRHFFEAFFDVYVKGSAIPWHHLVVVGIWGVGGLLLSIRYFRWVPREG